jgi:hypothetical protein
MFISLPPSTMLMIHDRKLMGESAMKFWKALAVGFGKWSGIRSQEHYEQLPLCSCHQNQMVARCKRHSDRCSLAENRPSIRDRSVADSLELRRRRNDKTRTSPLAEHALDECEEAFGRRDWPRFGYWHAVFLRERNRLNRPTRFL